MRVYSNPSEKTIRLQLSDGSSRLLRPWGMCLLPDADRAGRQLDVTGASAVKAPSHAVATSERSLPKAA